MITSASLQEYNSTLLSILVMQGIIVMAATNLPDILDPALTRPGRFDRHVSFHFLVILLRRISIADKSYWNTKN